MEVEKGNSLEHYLLEECIAMIKFLASNGKDIPSQAKVLLSCHDYDSSAKLVCETELIKIHQLLARKIAPARPKSVLLLYREAQKKNVLSFLGPVGLVRRLMFITLMSLIAFIAISISKVINIENIRSEIYEKHGVELLTVLAFYLASASMGACFNNMFQANKYIISNTYDAKHETSYWIRYVLGLLAGLILAVVIPVPGSAEGTVNDQVALMSRPVLAMLGGFSAALVYRILFRLVYAMESLFVGKGSDIAKSELARERIYSENEKENERQLFVNKLLTIQGLLKKADYGDGVEEEIDQIISDYSPDLLHHGDTTASQN